MPGTARMRGLADPFEPREAIVKSAELLRDLSRGNWSAVGKTMLASQQQAHVLTQSGSAPDVGSVSDIFQLDAPKVQSTATR
jgi:hypothetical protein